MRSVHYSLEEGAGVLGITEKTLKARLNRAGIKPTVDPTDHRRLLVSEADIKSVSRLDRVDGAATQNTLLGKCVKSVRGLLMWQKHTDVALHEYGDTVEAISQRVQQIEALTSLTLKKVDSMATSDDSQAQLREFMTELATSVDECRQVEQRVQTQVADFERDRSEMAALRGEIESGLRMMRSDIRALTEHVSSLEERFIAMNQGDRAHTGDQVTSR